MFNILKSEKILRVGVACNPHKYFSFNFIGTIIFRPNCSFNIGRSRLLKNVQANNNSGVYFVFIYKAIIFYFK